MRPGLSRSCAALIAFGVAAGLVACSALFGDAVQCKTDGECTRFAGAVCDLAQGVCVTSSVDDGAPPLPDQDQLVPPADGQGSGPDGPNESDADTAGDTSNSVDADPPDTAPPDPCKAANKPEVVIVGTAGMPLADGGLATVDITSDMTLACGNDYVLKGPVVVRSGAKLTIAKGTTVKGDVTTRGALYVMPGAKIEAVGTAVNPILFTSSKAAGARLPNDWAGLFILGKAGPAGQIDANPALAYGGGGVGAATDNSGTLDYVRVEYSGAPLVFAGAGNGTTLDFVQARRTFDSCFVFRGGTVNAKHLACQAPRAEAFEINGGYVGKMQFLVVQGRAPAGDDHEGLRVDGSFVTAYNATFCGDGQSPFGYGISPRNDSRMHLANVIVTGYSAGMVLYVTNPPTGTPFELVSSIFGANSSNPVYGPKFACSDAGDPNPYCDHANGFNEGAWFSTGAFNNSTQDPMLLPKCLATAPAFGPAVAFTASAQAPPADGFFEPVMYIGAAKDVNDTWATGAWASWNNQ